MSLLVALLLLVDSRQEAVDRGGIPDSSLPTAYCLLSTSRSSLPTAYCLLSTSRSSLPTAYCLLSTSRSSLPTAYCLLPTSSLADSLFEHRQFHDAATEYERFLFAQPEDSQAWPVRYKLAQAYAGSGELDRAEELLRQLPGGGAEEWAARALLAEGFRRGGRVDRAAAEYLDLLAICQDSGVRAETRRQLGRVEAEAGDFEAAGRHFAAAGDTAVVQECKRLSNLPRRNPDLAVLLSTVVPGSGEVYAGDWRRGLPSFLVNGAVIAGTVYSLGRGNYLDAGLLVTALLVRFYNGSRVNARDAAEEYNQRARARAAAELRRQLRAAGR